MTLEPTGLRSSEAAPRESIHTDPIAMPVMPEPALKRVLDILLSTVTLILSAPVFVLVALAIRVEDAGPIFYTQKRWGRGASHILVRKFRTMVPSPSEESGIIPARENDSRITRVGAFLRATGLDELPQIVSIWKGEMSFVGPRSLAVDEILHDENGNRLRYRDVPGFWNRLSVRPGLTSITTTDRPKDIHPAEKFRDDLVYVREQSIWLDLKLIILSFWISFHGRWESRDRKV